MDQNPGHVSGQVLLPCHMGHVQLSLSLPANLVLREVSSVIEASAVGGEFPGGLTQYCLWLRKERPGASEKLRSLRDGDEGRGHLRLLSGTVLIPEHLPRPGWG